MAEAGSSENGASAAPAAAPFYRYRDASGRVVIVDALERVPASARGSVEPVVLPAAPAPGIALAQGLARGELHWPSFGAGAGCALLAGVVLVGLLRLRGVVVRLLLLGGAALLGTGAYFGWVRRTTGHDAALLESPAARCR